MPEALRLCHSKNPQVTLIKSHLGDWTQGLMKFIEYQKILIRKWFLLSSLNSFECGTFCYVRYSGRVQTVTSNQHCDKISSSIHFKVCCAHFWWAPLSVKIIQSKILVKLSVKIIQSKIARKPSRKIRQVTSASRICHVEMWKNKSINIFKKIYT